jgi:membrane-bound lytic murein transglycosylase A
MSFHTPVWVDVPELAHPERRPSLGRQPFRRLMIAQDTGSAIIGPARGDLFFGAGDEAGAPRGQLGMPQR